MAARAKKRNFVQAYFSNFGIRQICDLLLLGGAIIMFVGVFVSDVVAIIGFCIYVVASLLAIYRSVKVLISKINHRSPEYRNALINTVIMSAIMLIAIFGIIYILVF